MKTQPQALAEAYQLSTGAISQSSDYGSVPESDKESRRSYKLHSSEGLLPISIQIREKTLTS